MLQIMCETGDCKDCDLFDECPGGSGGFPCEPYDHGLATAQSK